MNKPEKSFAINQQVLRNIIKLLETGKVVGFSFKSSDNNKDKSVVYIPRECARFEFDEKGISIWGAGPFMYSLKMEESRTLHVHMIN